MSSARAIGWRTSRGGLRGRLLIGAAALGTGLVAWHWDACHALAAEAYRSLTDAYLVMWIERAGGALGCF